LATYIWEKDRGGRLSELVKKDAGLGVAIVGQKGNGKGAEETERTNSIRKSEKQAKGKRSDGPGAVKIQRQRTAPETKSLCASDASEISGCNNKGPTGGIDRAGLQRGGAPEGLNAQKDNT